jgi:hypothetical protein
VVFGHIHASYGREDIIFDSVRHRYDDILKDWEGWPAFIIMFFGVLFARVKCLIWGRKTIIEKEKLTTFVNAAMVGNGSKNELTNAPVVVQI